MNQKIHSILAFLSILFFGIGNLSAQDFYAMDSIQKIEILFSQSNWDYILDTAKQGSDSYTMAVWVKINGVQFDSAGVKYKGNSSYNANNQKNPLHIELDHFKDQDYLGYKDIKLSNGYNEPSFVREVLLYTLFQNYGEASRANFAQVLINAQYMGVYTNVEVVTNTFLEDRFYNNNNTFVFADNGGCDLRYKGSDTTLYYSPYTMKSDYGWTDLRNLCDSLNNNINKIENILDIDRTLWHLAYLNAFVILDSYLGNSKHNYYMYEDDNERFCPIIWDLNGGIGIFNKPSTMAGLTIPQMQNLTPLLHATDSLWPLVKNILAVPLYKRMYIAHFKTLIEENIDNNSYFTLAQSIHNIIDTAVQSDPYKFGTYTQFIDNLTMDVVIGPKTVPGIASMMNARATYLNSTPEFLQVAPIISNVLPSDTFPLINSALYITATVSNATAVYLGSRNTVRERFNRVLMYDDGLHGDGASGDGVYGVALTITTPAIQYFIYADNNNAGVFSPKRAEHEYYTIQANYATFNIGDLVINEFMAINSTTAQNANAAFSDWVELYNNSSNTISLDNLTLSDDFSNNTKWAFPQGMSIGSNQYLIIWADDDTSSVELHCNFKLSGSGEDLVLAYANGDVLDSVSFSSQTADVTIGRYPNGTGSFVSMPPTFNAQNSLVAIDRLLDEKDLLVYPNPCTNFITVELPANYVANEVQLFIYNIQGELLLQQQMPQNKMDINSSNFVAGVYILKVFAKDISIVKKMVKG